jgi:hypothetical protein
MHAAMRWVGEWVLGQLCFALRRLDILVSHGSGR